MWVLLTISYNNIELNIIPTLYEGYIVSVHRILENRPVDPGSIECSHRLISFMIKHRTRANEFFLVKLVINNHVGLVHKNHTSIINEL